MVLFVVLGVAQTRIPKDSSTSVRHRRARDDEEIVKFHNEHGIIFNTELPKGRLVTCINLIIIHYNILKTVT